MTRSIDLVMTGCASANDRREYTVRSFQPDDRAEVDRLAREGLLLGHVDLSGSATNPDPQGSGAGTPTPESFWIVEARGQVIGTIALLQGGANVGRMLQLRVASEWQDDPAIAKTLSR